MGRSVLCGFLIPDVDALRWAIGEARTGEIDVALEIHVQEVSDLESRVTEERRSMKDVVCEPANLSDLNPGEVRRLAELGARELGV